jgi:predicted ribosome quality control (RQC) complex YloA/Tae2 family protein
MPMNEAELERVVADLQHLVGARVSGVWQPRRDRLLIGLDDTRLLLVPRGPHARLHSVVRRSRSPDNPFSFQGVCRASLIGPLSRIEKTAGDRIVDLWFGTRRLHLRLTGRRGGLWLLDGDAVVAAYDGPAPPTLPVLPPAPPTPSRHASPSFERRDGESWDAAAARVLGGRERDALRTERRQVLARRLQTQLARDRRLHIALHRDLEKAEQAPIARARADAVAARLHTLTRGQAIVTVPDLSDPDVEWSVALDPTRSPGANLERLYGRARRLDRMGDRVLEHLERVEARIATVDAALTVLDTADDARLAELEALAPTARRRTAGRSEPWATWTGPHGQRVLVGKNAAGNRRLSFQRARGDDVWLHLRERPGAHVLVPMDRGKTASLELLLAAAQIVVLTAKIPEGASADVQYTKARNVRSIKGAADGRVLVHDERVLHVTRDNSVLVGWSRDDQEVLDLAGLERLTTATTPPRPESG